MANWLDSAIAWAAPGVGLKRLRDRALLDGASKGSMRGSAYAAAGTSRKRTGQAWNRSSPGTEDSVVGAYDREKVRLELRDLYRNNEITRAIVDRFVSYVVWTGIWPQAQSDDEGWNTLAEDYWRDVVVPTADYRQRPGVDLVAFQKMVVRARLLEGELAFALQANGQLQPIEAERIQTPPDARSDESTVVVDGLRVARRGGLITGFFVCGRSDSGAVDRAAWQFVNAEDLFYCGEPFRPDQLRGIPDLAPAVNKLRDYDETDENVFAKVKSDAMNLYNRKPDDGGGLENDMPRNSYTTEDSDDKDPTRTVKAEWGQVMDGVQLEPIESKTPNQQYVEYLKHQLVTLGAAIGMPREYMMMLWDGSFSANKAAMLHGQHAFQERHGSVVKMLCQPHWNWRMAKAIKMGDLPAPKTWRNPATGMEISRWWRVKWSVPLHGWVDPLDQVRTDKERWDLGKESLKTQLGREGEDRAAVFQGKREDLANACEEARILNKTYPEAGATFRDIIQTGTPGLTKIASPAPAPAPGAE